MEWVKKVLELDEWDYISMIILGRFYLYSEEYDKVEYYFWKVLRINVSDVENLIYIVCGLIFLGYLEEVYYLYEKVCFFKLIDDVFLMVGVFILFELGCFEEVLEVGECYEKGVGWVDFLVVMVVVCYY